MRNCLGILRQGKPGDDLTEAAFSWFLCELPPVLENNESDYVTVVSYLRLLESPTWLFARTTCMPF